MTLKQKTTTLPGYSGTNYTSEIVITPNGRFIYIANRLHNSIGIFAVAADGQVRWLGEEWTRGDYPRNIALDPSGRFMYVCNHRSDNITIFRVQRPKRRARLPEELCGDRQPGDHHLLAAERSRMRRALAGLATGPHALSAALA